MGDSMASKSTPIASITNSPGLVQSSKTSLYRASGVESKSAQVKLYKERVFLKKELDRLERQAHTAINNVDNNKQNWKMAQRKIEKRAQDTFTSHSLTSLDRRHRSTSGDRRTLLQNRTVIHTMPAASDLFGAKDTLSVESSAEQRKASDIEREGTGIKTPSPYHSPYISSPSLYVRRSTLPIAFKPPSKLVPRAVEKKQQPARVAESGENAATTSPRMLSDVMPHPVRDEPAESLRTRSASENHIKLPPLSARGPTLQIRARPGTASKKKLKRVDLDGLGLEGTGKQSPDFRHFYNSKTPYIKAVFTSGQDAEDSDSDGEGKSQETLEELASRQTLEELYGEIQHCRYIRLYEPNNHAHPGATQPRAHVHNLAKVKTKKVW